MTQTAIPYLFMRGGTSRGPYFNRADLPEDRETLAEVLLAVVGSGHPLNIDGIGGGAAVTTKVAMLSPSEDAWADVDYFFAQVSVELGLVQPTGDVTDVKIHAVNTGAKVLSKVLTPGGVLTYDGDTEIAGVPGAGAAVALNFMGVVGSSTGAF